MKYIVKFVYDNDAIYSVNSLQSLEDHATPAEIANAKRMHIDDFVKHLNAGLGFSTFVIVDVCHRSLRDLASDIKNLSNHFKILIKLKP